jgi:hypothetical protein
MSTLPDITGNHELAPSREEIQGTNGVGALLAMQERCECEEVTIRTTLEFPDDPNDVAWFRRARLALIHFRVALTRIDRQIKAIKREKDIERMEAKKRATAGDTNGHWRAGVRGDNQMSHPNLTLRELRAHAQQITRESGDVLAVRVGTDALASMRNLPNFMPAPYRTMEAKPNELGVVEIFRFYSTPDPGWSIVGTEAA